VIRGVLLDLDDTLFDHTFASRQALAAVCESHPGLCRAEHPELVQQHGEILEALHVRVLRGELTVDEARHERFRTLFERAGIPSDDEPVRAAAAAYRAAYVDAWREVPGATELLATLAGRVRLGIVSNNVAREQREKIRACGLDPHLNGVVISEEVCVSKPDPAIFRIALAVIGTTAAQTVMVGDSWQADVAGARAAGMRAVWFNPRGRPRPDAWDDVVEIGCLEPACAVASVICGATSG
jgi:putative hydrolase of the HAD superfamily